MKLYTLLATAVSFSSLVLLAQGEPLVVGATAPEISALDQDGKTVSFKDVYAKGPTLVHSQWV